MKTLLIVFHSLTGGTRQMAEAAMRGAVAIAEVDVRLLWAADAAPADVLAADGYIFATPENLAAIAGLMKDFFDRTYYPVLDRINGRPYAALICAGSDGQNAARQIERISHRLASSPSGRSDHRLHPRANARDHPGAKANGVCRSRSLRGDRCRARGGSRGGDLLTRLDYLLRAHKRKEGDPISRPASRCADRA